MTPRRAQFERILQHKQAMQKFAELTLLRARAVWRRSVQHAEQCAADAANMGAEANLALRSGDVLLWNGLGAHAHALLRAADHAQQESARQHVLCVQAEKALQLCELDVERIDKLLEQLCAEEKVIAERQAQAIADDRYSSRRHWLGESVV